jgi:hypothetical protein
MTQFLKTDLVGKIGNLPSFKNEALLPVFEAVSNSIHAIEEYGNIKTGEITIKVKRSSEVKLPGFQEEGEKDKIIGFEIIDNGCGFNDVNYDSFLTADSTHKLQKGGKGVGRFFWLKAFDRVEIESVFECEDGARFRQIGFSLKNGIIENQNVQTDRPRETIVKLIGFKEVYQQQPSAYKTTAKIAQRIMENCLSYLIGNVAPSIFVEDDDGTLSIESMFNEIKDSITSEEFKIQEQDFSISHVKLYSTHQKVHNILLCANNRGVKSVGIGNLIGTSTHFDEDDKKFFYSAYISSPYLDEHVNISRTDFDIPENSQQMSINDCPISISDIKNAITDKSKKFLSEFIEILSERKQEIVSNHVSNINPTLRAVPNYCPEIFDEIEPNSSEEKIDEILYRYKGKTEYKIRKRSENLLKTQATSIEEIQEEYESLCNQLEDFQKDQLAGYIIFRKMIIDLLDKKIELNASGKYSNEDIIHDIIFPRKSSSDELNFKDHNMWLIDERLTFHAFATSDNRLCDSVASESQERPDIITFAEIDEDKTARAVSIIEFKKPQRLKFDEDPTRQLYRYIRKVKENKVLLPNGRNLYVNETTRFYCYAVCDLNNNIREFAENNNYAMLKGERGFYIYNRNLNAHTEIIAYDKIVSDVKQRHKMFFEKLGL